MPIISGLIEPAAGLYWATEQKVLRWGNLNVTL